MIKEDVYIFIFKEYLHPPFKGPFNNISKMFNVHFYFFKVAVDPVIFVILDSSMVYTGGGIIVLQKILAAELGYCVQYTMFISSMHIFLKASIET